MITHMSETTARRRQPRVAFVNVNVRSEGPETLVGYMPPYGLLCVAGPIIDASFQDVVLVDGAVGNMGITETVEQLNRTGCDVVFLSSMASTAGMPMAGEIAEALKTVNPTVQIATGGVHASYMHSQVMAEYPAIDFIGRGEGEKLGVELITCLTAGDDLSQVSGLVWRRGNEVVVNPLRRPMTNSELSAQRVAWEIVPDWDQYRVPMTGERAAVVQFSRGCPFGCTFCGQWDFWTKWRHRDVDRFVDELAMLRAEFGVTYFFMADENPQTDPGIWYSLLEKLRDRDIGVHLTLNLRATDIIRDREKLQLYREAGIVTVDIGAESALQTRLDQVKKHTSIQENREAVRLLAEAGILSIVQTLVGFPDETEESLMETFAALEEWAPNLLHFYHVTPFPWTADGSALSIDRIAEPDLSKWDYRHQVLRMDRMTTEKLKYMTKSFTFRYNYSTKNFKRIMEIEDPYQRDSMINALHLILLNRSRKLAFTD